MLLAIPLLLAPLGSPQPQGAPDSYRVATGISIEFVKTHPKPNYDLEVLQPLRESQLKTKADCDVLSGTLDGLKCVLPPPPPPVVIPAPVVVPAGSGDVVAAITKWAGVYGVSPDWLLRVAKCESGFNTGSINHGYYAGGGNPSGIFQFLPQTFYANAARIGLTGADLWNYDNQAQVAAWMFSIGQYVQWECK